MKKICFFNSSNTWGGGEKWHLETSIYMLNKGYDVLFITNKNSALHHKLKNTDIKYITLNIKSISFINPFYIYKVKNILKTHGINVIVMNLSRDLKIAGLSSKWAGIKKIIYRRGSSIPIKNNFLNRFYFKHIVTDLLANSLATKNTVIKNNTELFPEEKIEVIYNGLSIDNFSNNNYVPVYSKKEGELILTSLGRLEYEKNHKFLIQVSQELKHRGIKFKLIIGGSGSEMEALQGLSKTLHVEDSIIFLGFIENPKDLLKTGDVFLLPSLWEGFGYVLAEAALCKKPAIAFNISCIPEIVIHNKTGFLTPLNDVKLFADKIEELTKNPVLLKQMGNAAYNYVSTKFNSKIILEKIERYLVQ